MDNSLDNSRGPWFRDSVSRSKLRGSRLVDAEPGLLGLVARSRSNWVEGWGVGSGGFAARTLGGDGEVEAEKFNFVWVSDEFQILPCTQHFQQLHTPPSLWMAVFLIDLDPNGLAKSHLID